MEDIKNKEYPAPSGSGTDSKLQNTTARETKDHVSAENKTEEYKPKGSSPGKLGAY
tara:strand:- start:180 stop:347 length:168 start_codon:yes stop_codon:yes gene_type:complete